MLFLSLQQKSALVLAQLVDFNARYSFTAEVIPSKKWRYAERRGSLDFLSANSSVCSALKLLLLNWIYIIFINQTKTHPLTVASIKNIKCHAQ
jgi:hypothetical protein